MTRVGREIHMLEDYFLEGRHEPRAHAARRQARLGSGRGGGGRVEPVLFALDLAYRRSPTNRFPV